MGFGRASRNLALSAWHSKRAPIRPRMGTCKCLRPAENRGFRFAVWAVWPASKGVAGFLPSSLSPSLQGTLRVEAGRQGWVLRGRGSGESAIPVFL